MSRARKDKAADGAAEAAVTPYLQAFFNAAANGLCLLDVFGRVVAANAAMGRLFGPQAVELGRPWAAGAAHDPPAGQAEAREEAVVGPDGVSRRIEIVGQPLVDAAGRPLGRALVAWDVTARFASRREMELAAQDIEMLLGSIRSILVTLDGENRVRRFNASAEAAFGLAALEATGRDFFDLDLDWDGPCLAEAVAKSRATQLPVRVDEVRCRTCLGGERLLGFTVNPVPGGSAPVGVLILGQDLTDIKARELKALHERRMQAIGQLASGIAHEINTPIQYVGYNAGFLDEAFADLLSLLAALDALADAAAAGEPQAVTAALGRLADAREAVDPDYLRQEIPAAIANTRKGIRQVTDIVAAMRQLSHPGAGDALFFDLNAAVRDIVTITRNAWKHVAEVELDLAPDLPLVYGQPHEVSQVLLNVVLNAAQAVEERCRNEPLSRGRIGIVTSQGPKGVAVSVADNGPGIDPAAAGRIFDPFFTTKPAGQGTGQGLAISHAIMARLGGTIDFTSRPGEGATFFIRFPAEDAGGGRS